MRVLSASPTLPAMDNMRSLTLDATASISRGSPATRSVYDRLRIVTRTDCLSSMRPVPSRQTYYDALNWSCAQLINLAQQLFNPAAHLFALGLQRFHFFSQTGGIGLSFRRLHQCCF